MFYHVLFKFQGLKPIAACMRYDMHGRPLDSISVSGNAPEWAEEGFRAVDRSGDAFLGVSACIVQVLKAYKQLLHPCNAVHAVNRSMSPLDFLKWRLRLKTPPERSIALKGHS